MMDRSAADYKLAGSPTCVVLSLLLGLTVETFLNRRRAAVVFRIKGLSSLISTWL
jgi:hypothetical protein